MNQFLIDIGEKIGAGIVGLSLIVGSVFGYTPPPQNFAATFQTPEVRALFETTLASRISATDTSFTLTSATDIDGTALASSTYAFIIDEGTASEELVLADCTATACTNATRGLSGRTGTTTVASLQSEHRRGASVKITDAPALIFAMNVFKGSQYLENILRYNSNLTFTADQQIVSKKYVDDIAFSGAGVIDATSAARGVVELATQLETASSTAVGGSGNLAIPSSNATSTYNSATAALRVVVTQNNGKIDPNFVDISTYTGNITGANLTITGSSNVASTTIYATTTSGTWTKPANLRYLIAEVVGGGGGGGGSTNSYNASPGGGGGGYAKKVIPAGALGATETVTIGAGGTAAANTAGGNGGTTSFGSHVSATGGTGAATGQAGDAQSGGAGGTGSGGDVNIAGSIGGNGVGPITGSNASVVIGGNGGDSQLGQGASMNLAAASQERAGIAGSLYGGGGSGSAQASANSDIAGGAGAAGIVILTYVFF